MKKTLIALVVLVFSAATVSAEPFVWPDAWTANPGAPDRVEGETSIRSSTLSGSRTFNPFVVSEQNVVMSRSFYDVSLIRRDLSTRQWIPYAAESLEFSDDGLTAVATLRQGVKWSDGKEVTVDDYIFYYQAITDEEIGSTSMEDFLIGDDFVEVEKTGSYEITFTFPATDRTAYTVVSNLYPAPDHILGELYRTGGAEALKGAWGTDVDLATTVWAGPHVPVSYITDERFVFARNPYFDEWNVDERGNPVNFIDDYSYTVAGQDAQLNLYVGNELDFYSPNNLDSLGLVATAIDAGEIDATLLESVYPQASTTFYMFNWNKASDPFKQELFRNATFRQAMSHLTPREAIVDLVHQGAGVPAYSPVGRPYTFWYPEAPLTFPYDPAAASEKLASIGFTGETDADGCLVDADGNALRFLLTTNAGNASREQTIQLIADAAREVGVCVDTQALDFSLLVDQLTGEGDDRAFDAILIGFGGDTEDWPFSQGIFSCTGGFHMWNLSGDCIDPQERLVSVLNQRGRATLDDAAAQQIGYDLMDAFAELQPMIYTTSASLHSSWLNSVGGNLPEDLFSSFNGTRDVVLTYKNQ